MTKRIRIDRHRSALERHELSRPMRLALKDGLVTDETSVFDYGCGRGGDVQRLRTRGIVCAGWDPVHASDQALNPSDVVNLGYVLNVIEDPAERVSTLESAWALASSALVVSARLTIDARLDTQKAYGDGYLTRIDTFQKYYEQGELREFLRATLDTVPVAAAPGVFYCFRNAARRESFLATRYRRRSSQPRIRKSDVLYEQHKESLASLIDFISVRGRLPIESELAVASMLIRDLGSLKRAFALIRRVTGKKPWDERREMCREDLAIYLALAKFEGRPRFSELPEDIRRDVRALFSTYKHACSRADELLFSVGDTADMERACRACKVGKHTPSALYIHESVLVRLPTKLRMYEGCARAYIGTVEGANLIKLHTKKPAVSYLWYPTFERDPHPVLARSLFVDLSGPRVRHRDYTSSKNPPILHRKEEFIADGHPLHAKFARLTRIEESWGLYANPNEIGYLQPWTELLGRYGLCFRGHRLIRQK